MEAICQSCELEHCVCYHTDMPTFIVGKEVNMFVGIANSSRDNNCFLSVAIQCLLNFDSFQNMLLEPCPQNDSCAICCMKKVSLYMKHAKKSNKKNIHINEIRSDLEKICQGQFFKAGSLGDAMEALEIILNAIHNSSAENFDSTELIQNQDCQIECGAHRICFNKIEQSFKCRCSTLPQTTVNMSFTVKLNSEWFKFRPDEKVIEFFNDKSYFELEGHYETSGLKKCIGTFSKIVKSKVGESLNDDFIGECSKCRDKYRIEAKLTSDPQIMIFQVNWSNIFNIELLEILQFCLSLQGKIRFGEMFHEVESDAELGLRGLIVYLNEHYVYFTIGDDFSWYKIDDNLCYLVGAGRWYDVILNLLYMKGIIVGLIYEELNIADLSLYKIELLILEKVVYNTIVYKNNEAGIMDTVFDYIINPRIKLKPRSEVKCIFCTASKRIGDTCGFCLFNPNEKEWFCKKCEKINSGLNFMCDDCDTHRLKWNGEPKLCLSCNHYMEWVICTRCDILFVCKKCGKPKTPLQSCFCAGCKQPCRDGYCTNDKSYEMICKKCCF